MVFLNKNAVKSVVYMILKTSATNLEDYTVLVKACTSKSVDYTVLLETNAIKSTVYVMPMLKRTCNLTMSYSTAPVQEYMDAQITSQSFHQMFGAAPPSSSRLHAGTDVHRYSSYSGSSFSTSFDPDNVPVDRSPVYSG